MEVRKTVTVLFADVIGSTSIGESLDPESVRMLMSRYFDEMRSAVEQHGGTVEKFIGDAVMAVFGVPVAYEDDALRAIRAAMKMREQLESLNAELDPEWGARLQVRTGINTGEVVAGDPAGGQPFVTGDAVNVAARLEQAAAPGEILLGERTLALVRDATIVESLEPLELKGKAERVPAFRLLDLKAGAPSFERRLDSPFVGREPELARLQAELEDAIARRVCRIATVVGEAGLGKSRLVTELVHRAKGMARALWGRCLPYGEGITFWPIAEVVKDAADIGEADPPDLARSKVRRLVAGVDDGAEVADAVDVAIGLGGGTGDLQSTFWGVRRLLEILAADTPLVVVLEDIHWAEPAFLDLLHYVAGFSADHPLFLLCTARPGIREIRPDWGDVADLIVLDPFTAGESERLIENLLGRGGLVGDVRTRIMAAAEGNPLFVEELLRKLIDDGKLRRDNGHWTPTGDLSGLAVPGTIAALISARLDQLETEERAVIQRASVAGKTFWWGAVSELSPDDDRSQVGSHLHTLLRKELVRPDRSVFVGEDAFRFSHILVRDAAYESMPKRMRAELHERFATWLERKAGAGVVEFEQILGYHLEQAYRYRAELGPVDDAARQVAGRAAVWLAAAGRRSYWDPSATVNLLSRAIDLLPRDDPFRLDLLPDLGTALIQSDIPYADRVLTEAIEAAMALGDLHLEARAGLPRLYAHLLIDPMADQQGSLDEVERYVGLFEEWSDERGLAEATRLVGQIRFWQGRAATAEETFERAIVHARRAGDRRQESEIRMWSTMVISTGPAPADDGIRQLERILDETSGNRRVEIAVLSNIADLEGLQGNFEAARGHSARAKVLARELGDHVRMGGVLRDAAAIEMLAGDLIAAEAEARAGYELLQSIGDIGHLASITPDLGHILYELGRHEEAFELSKEAERITIKGDVDAEVSWRQLRARVLAQRGEFDQGRRIAEEAVALAAKTDYLRLHALALNALAEVLQFEGRNAEAATVVRKEIELHRRKGNLVDEARAASLLAELGV